MKKILIFIGPPGSGKGTQAKLLVEKFAYKHISTGDLLRNLAKKTDVAEDEKLALDEMKAGKLVPDWLIYRLAYNEIKTALDSGQGVVLDGTIRNLEQAEQFEQFFAHHGWADEVQVVEVALSDEEIFDRLTRRRLCASCGNIIPYLPSTVDLKVCPKCGGELVYRADDTEEVIKNRIKDQGNAATKPILDFYNNLGVLSSVDGRLSIEEVSQNIYKILE